MAETADTRTNRRALYVAREAAIVVAATAFGLPGSTAAQIMINHAVQPMLQGSTVSQHDAISAVESLTAPLLIIVSYFTMRLARWIRDCVPFPSDGNMGFDAYGAVSTVCGLNILFNIFYLPWRVLWS